ncbi:MAG: DUF1801 domain-containing protein [Micrococcales bacterium]|nr:DUF1801 domain-containing protein [Micrococcales bacterium]
MAQPKTRPTDADVAEFLAAVPSARRREDAEHLAAIMTELTGTQPVMWGPSIVGFGQREYTNTTGTQEWFKTGFSRARPAWCSTPWWASTRRSRNWGPHTTGKGCLHIKDLRAVDEAALREIITASLEEES